MFKRKTQHNLVALHFLNLICHCSFGTNYFLPKLVWFSSVINNIHNDPYRMFVNIVRKFSRVFRVLMLPCNCQCKYQIDGLLFITPRLFSKTYRPIPYNMVPTLCRGPKLNLIYLYIGEVFGEPFTPSLCMVQIPTILLLSISNIFAVKLMSILFLYQK